MKHLLALLLLALMGPALAADPAQRQWRENREGRSAFDAGDFEAARDHFARRVEMAPDDPRAHFNLGNALASLGLADEAEAAWNEAARLAGTGSLARDARFNQGVSAMEAGTPDLAVKRLAEALSLDPADADARRNLELALRQMQEQQQNPQDQQQQDQGQQDQDQEDQQQQNQQQGQDEQQEQDQQSGDQQEEKPQDQQQNQQQDQQNEEEQPQDQQSQGPQGEDQQPPQESSGESAKDKEAKEQAKRVLERLAESEKDALEKDLKKRIEAESTSPKKGKKW